MNRYISKSYTTSKKTIDRQYTERGQLKCQLLLVLLLLLTCRVFCNGKEKLFWYRIAFFFCHIGNAVRLLLRLQKHFTLLSDFRSLDSFSLCCYATRVLNHVDCNYSLSTRDSLSSCNRMIEDLGPRKIIWLLGVLAVLGNLAVMAWRLIRRDDHPVQTCLLTNLAVSDFLMGVYLMIVAIQDQIWAGNFDLVSI